MSRDWLLYLDDLIESAEKIERFLKGRSLDAFTADELLFDAVLFNLEVIGEAVKKLPAEAKSAAPEADWTGPARMAMEEVFGPSQGFFRIVDALEQVSPAAVLVDFIQKEQRLAGRQFGPPQPRRDGRMIPVEVGGVRGVRALAEEAQRKGRLADLARAADEHHRLAQRVGDARPQVACGMH